MKIFSEGIAHWKIMQKAAGKEINIASIAVISLSNNIYQKHRQPGCGARLRI